MPTEDAAPNDGTTTVLGLAMVLLAPLAAGIIQMAISRQREYSADATGADICGNPESLASALLRLEEGAKAIPMQVNQASEPLYIVKPFSAGGIASLFSTLEGCTRDAMGSQSIGRIVRELYGTPAPSRSEDPVSV